METVASDMPFALLLWSPFIDWLALVGDIIPWRGRPSREHFCTAAQNFGEWNRRSVAEWRNRSAIDQKPYDGGILKRQNTRVIDWDRSQYCITIRKQYVGCIQLLHARSHSQAGLFNSEGDRFAFLHTSLVLTGRHSYGISVRHLALSVCLSVYTLVLWRYGCASNFLPYSRPFIPAFCIINSVAKCWLYHRQQGR